MKYSELIEKKQSLPKYKANITKTNLITMRQNESYILSVESDSDDLNKIVDEKTVIKLIKPVKLINPIKPIKKKLAKENNKTQRNAF